MAQSKTLKHYAVEKCLIGYGLINGIINAVIFRAMHAGDGGALFTLPKIAFDMALTGFLLGAILVYCVVPLTLKDCKKGVYQAEGEFLSLAKCLPASKLLTALIVGVVAAVVAVAFSMAVVAFMPLPLDVPTMMILKGSACAVGGAVAGFLTILKATYSRVLFGANEAKLSE